jgi:hypothetical protein
MEKDPLLYGVLAEFDGEHELLEAGRRAYQHGYRHMDAYSPMPIQGMSAVIGFPKTRLPLVVLIGGLAGCFGGFLMQYWISVIDYPLNIGGRPLNSWPAFIPVTFEMTILCAALAAALGMLALNGLPRPHHPLFNAPSFAGVTRNKFFLCIEATDPKFERDQVRRFLLNLNPREVTDVEQ